jgi:periplasmic protein TonB
MAETTDTTHEEHHERSVFDEPKKKRNTGVTVAIVGSIIVHAGLGYYLYKSRFEPKYREYSDDVTDVAIIKPAPPPTPPRPSVITNPDWARRPSGEDVARYYPDRAMRMNIEGRATLSCQVTAKGTLENCSVDSEEPADQDFGAAALRMSKLFRMRPKTQDGAPVEGGTVRIPIRFTLPKG